MKQPFPICRFCVYGSPSQSSPSSLLLCNCNCNCNCCCCNENRKCTSTRRRCRVSSTLFRAQRRTTSSRGRPLHPPTATSAKVFYGASLDRESAAPSVASSATKSARTSSTPTASKVGQRTPTTTYLPTYRVVSCRAVPYRNRFIDSLID